MPNQKTTPLSKNNPNNYRQKIAPFRRYTNRTVHFATKVTPEFDETIRQLAHEKQCLISEMLDNFMESYLEKEKKDKKTITKSDHSKKKEIKNQEAKKTDKKKTIKKEATKTKITKSKLKVKK